MPYVIGQTRAGYWTWVYVESDSSGFGIKELLAVTNMRTKSYEACSRLVEATAASITDYEGIATASKRGGYYWRLDRNKDVIFSHHVFATNEAAAEECRGVILSLTTANVMTVGVKRELWLNPRLSMCNWDA